MNGVPEEKRPRWEADMRDRDPSICWVLNLDGTRACLLSPHDGPHGWQGGDRAQAD